MRHPDFTQKIESHHSNRNEADHGSEPNNDKGRMTTLNDSVNLLKSAEKIAIFELRQPRHDKESKGKKKTAHQDRGEDGKDEKSVKDK